MVRGWMWSSLTPEVVFFVATKGGDPSALYAKPKVAAPFCDECFFSGVLQLGKV